MAWSRTKFEGRDSEDDFAPASLELDEDEFAGLMLLVFYMGRVDSRLLAASRAVMRAPTDGESIYVIICVEGT